MLKRLRLKNFQKHDRLIVEFDAITTIIGDNDRGKSTILRALRWVCLNDRRGNSFIKRDTTRTRVSLEEDDHRIVRVRGARTNLYTLDGQEYKSFHNSVPSDISNILQCDAINFQRQHESPFWFALTPAQVSRELNSIVNLEAIDQALALASQRLKKAKLAVDLSQSKLQDARTERVKLAWVPELDERLRQLEQQHKRIVRLGKEAKALRLLLRKGRKLKRRMKVEWPDLSEMDALLKRIEDLEERRSELAYLLQQIRNKRKQIKWLKEQSTRLGATLTKELKGRCPVCGQSMKRIDS